MIYIGTRSALKAKFTAEIIREIDDRKPISVKDLEFAFVGNDGKKYYHFADHLTMPPERFAMKKATLALMHLGLAPSEIDALIETGEGALYEGLKAKKSASTIMFVFAEFKRRRNLVLHVDLIYFFIALHYVREDESAEVYSAEIQDQKIEVFKKEVAEKGSSFFLTKPELKDLYEMSNWSEIEWIVFWHESLVTIEAQKIMLQQLKQEQKQESESTESKSG